MSQQLKPGVAKTLKIAKYAFIVLAIACVVYFVKNSSKKVTESQKIDQISMATGFDQQKVTTSNKLPLPDFNNPVGSGTPIKFEIMAWNSQFPLMYANGGVKTSKGSLFAKNGIDCEIIRQDDCNQSIKDFEANAEQLANGKTQVPMVVCYMGDGVPGMSSGLNAIKKFKHRAIAFYPMGRSNGEDCFWGPADWKSHPEHCLGKCVVGVERDGDMNIVLKWASDNNIRINPNTKTWDSGALNIIACSDFNTDLCNKIINGYSEERDVQVSDGKGGATTKAGQKHHCTADAFTTWTPADVTVAMKKGGFTRLASTAEYTMQMPNIAIIDANWAEAHPDQMHAIIKSLGEAGGQVQSFPEAQEFAAKVSAKVYNEKDANYWLKYYRGSDETDKQGNKVRLGGSQAFNLADAAMMFGLGNETPQVDRYKITYEMFGGILSKLYPKEMEGMTPYADMVDKSYLSYVLDHNADLKNGKTEASTNEYASGTTVTEQVSEAKFDIKFNVGSDVIDPSSYSKLDEVAKSAIISGSLTIFVYGHTDATGNPATNMTLSKRRAKAVAAYLHSKGVPMCENCKENRIQYEGYGSDKPVYGDASDIRNRCVEIIQGK
jgi:outer membrane protein OmpA-like peptidoglycan-associated protein